MLIIFMKIFLNNNGEVQSQNNFHHFEVNTVKPVYAEPPREQIMCSEWTGVHFVQVRLTKISYIVTLFIVWFIQ
jgi:hypothetical protein